MAAVSSPLVMSLIWLNIPAATLQYLNKEKKAIIRSPVAALLHTNRCRLWWCHKKGLPRLGGASVTYEANPLGQQQRATDVLLVFNK